MLKLLNITKEYKVDEESILALHAVNIEFRKNEFVSILGPSGCGKTTLLNIIGGLDRYSIGDIQISGVSTKEYDDVDWDTYRNRKIGFVFQSYNLIPHMNILKNVAMSLTLAGVSYEERKERALEALAKVGLASQARKKPNQLSGGQMQRVAIARALVNNPEIILADEPTGALDSESGIQIMDLLKEVAEDRLVIMVTHNPLLAEQYSTRIVYLKDGEVAGDTMPCDNCEENANKENAVSDKIKKESVQYANKLSKTNKSKKSKIVDAHKIATKVGDAVSSENPVENNVNDKKSAEDIVTNQDTVNSEKTVGDTVNSEKTVGDTVNSENSSQTTSKSHKTCCCAVRKKSKFEIYRSKVRQSDKSSMKIRTAVSLSFNNLLNKKGRTLLTSIAGSIGIIGIILVLSLSSGISGYVKTIEENALSQYPIQINESNADINAILKMMSDTNSVRPDFPSSDVIHTNKVIGNLLSNLSKVVGKNDLASLKTYLDENFDESLGQVKYDYGTSFNVYSQNIRQVGTGDNKVPSYSKLYPFSDVMEGIIGGAGMPGLPPEISGLASMLDSWDEISDDTRLLNQQYDLLGKSSWPNDANEIVIVLDEKNQINDYTLFMLGLKSVDDVGSLIDGTMASSTFTVDELLKLKYSVLTNADYLEKNPDGQTWKSNPKSIDTVEFIDAHKNKELELRVVGVVRPKKGAVVTSINSVVGYTHALTEKLIDSAKTNEAIIAQNKAYQDGGSSGYTSKITYSYNIPSQAQPITITAGQIVEKKVDTTTNVDESYVELMRSLGVVELAKPKSIKIYCSTFEAKDKIVALLKNYETETGNSIKYTDFLEMIMGYVRTMTKTITGALIGFSAISLLVSTIMIAIIIYTSVLERRKEIGVLRSLGARKKDISRVFLAESAMLGGYSGVIGLMVSAIIAAIGNFVLLKLFNISGLMQITWWHCIMMIGISVFLSMFAGFIPSRIAARKDPAIALRSE